MNNVFLLLYVQLICGTIESYLVFYIDLITSHLVEFSNSEFSIVMPS